MLGRGAVGRRRCAGKHYKFMGGPGNESFTVISLHSRGVWGIPRAMMTRLEDPRVLHQALRCPSNG